MDIYLAISALTRAELFVTTIVLCRVITVSSDTTVKMREIIRGIVFTDHHYV